MKHVRIDRNFIKEEIKIGINLVYISPLQQETHILTKVMLKSSFESLISKLGLTDIYTTTEEQVLKSRYSFLDCSDCIYFVFLYVSLFLFCTNSY